MEVEDLKYKKKYAMVPLKYRPEFIHSAEKMNKWMSRKEKGYIIPIPAPLLIECPKCFKVYSSDEYRAHKRRENKHKHLRIKLANGKGKYPCLVADCDFLA